jgi:mono/diheme cytochrome c family protein
MRTLGLVLSGVVLAGTVLALGGLAYVRTSGLESRSEPGAIETRLARVARRLAVPDADRRLRNPVAATPENLAAGMAHYADHCASCHANDGSGETQMGLGLFPKAPDMRLAPTQELSDGELFYVIENGIRFTGMPAWATGTEEGKTSSWQLVQFVRHLPLLTAAELEQMRGMNPRSPEEIRLEIEEERFLSEGAPQ